MNDIQNQRSRDNRRPRGLEMKFHLRAVGAFKARRDFAFIRQATTLAKRRLDKAHASPAVCADVTFVRRRGFGIAELTGIRIKEAQPGIKPAFHPGLQRSGSHPSSSGSIGSLGSSFLRANPEAAKTIKASQPSISFPVPQNQLGATVASRLRKP